mmetsp:Transcript_40119/g.91532  ORF Transcript_40119/g.91532 Transcript_40119/m.91532 type:complete len:234 (+) Transcript_40119:24-725(+)
MKASLLPSGVSVSVLSHDRGETSALPPSRDLFFDPAKHFCDVPCHALRHGYRHPHARTSRQGARHAVRHICGLRFDFACVRVQRNDAEGLALQSAPELVLRRVLSPFDSLAMIEARLIDRRTRQRLGHTPSHHGREAPHRLLLGEVRLSQLRVKIHLLPSAHQADGHPARIHVAEHAPQGSRHVLEDDAPLFLPADVVLVQAGEQRVGVDVRAEGSSVRTADKHSDAVHDVGC